MRGSDGRTGTDPRKLVLSIRGWQVRGKEREASEAADVAKESFKAAEEDADSAIQVCSDRSVQGESREGEAHTGSMCLQGFPMQTWSRKTFFLRGNETLALHCHPGENPGANRWVL